MRLHIGGDKAQEIGKLHVHLLAVGDVEVVAHLAGSDNARRVVRRLVRVGRIDEEHLGGFLRDTRKIGLRDRAEPFALDDVAAFDRGALLIERGESAWRAFFSFAQTLGTVSFFPQCLADGARVV